MIQGCLWYNPNSKILQNILNIFENIKYFRPNSTQRPAFQMLQRTKMVLMIQRCLWYDQNIKILQNFSSRHPSCFLSPPGYSPVVISERPGKFPPNLKDFTRILSSDLDNLFVTSVLKDRSFQDEVQVMNGTISR